MGIKGYVWPSLLVQIISIFWLRIRFIFRHIFLRIIKRLFMVKCRKGKQDYSKDIFHTNVKFYLKLRMRLFLNFYKNGHTLKEKVKMKWILQVCKGLRQWYPTIFGLHTTKYFLGTDIFRNIKELWAKPKTSSSKYLILDLKTMQCGLLIILSKFSIKAFSILWRLNLKIWN